MPTDSIQYYSYWIRLKDQRLRNTAGCERDGSVVLGYAGYHFHTDVRVSDSYSKSGFFANAHGLEVRLSDIDTGDYHFMIRLTDRAGWQQLHAVAVKIVE